MKRRKPQHIYSHYVKVLMLLVLGLGALKTDALAQTEQINLEQVISLLEGDIPESEIIERIRQYQVDFLLTNENLRTLIRQGASDELLEAIEMYQYRELVITSLVDDDECGSQLRVEGRSDPFPDKHLWLFAHRRGLAVWWPQGGEVFIEENGEWMQSAFIGQPQHVGFKFEVKAMWVGEEVHTQLMEYLRSGELSGRFPGIQLPEGSPVVQVTCRRVNK